MSGAVHDPRLDALERHRVNFVVIGGLARVIDGADEVTRDVDICPQLKAENFGRLVTVLDSIDARGVPESLRRTPPELDGIAQVDRTVGHPSIVPTPVGTRGWDDLRHRANREPLGGGLRAAIAGPGDLIRTLEGLDRDHDQSHRDVLRVIADLDRSRGVSR